MTRAAPAMARAALLLLATVAPGVSNAGAPRDAEFGVTADGAIGLERQVVMYQWERHGDGYRKAWRAGPVDSADFAPGHENPREMPLRGHRWAPGKVMLDGKPVAQEAVDALARWQGLRPDFSSMPGNLSATFQPEGDGLGSAANPVHPEIGDLRITWRALRMPRTFDGLVLRDGRWELDAAALDRHAQDREAPKERVTRVAPGMLAAAIAAGIVLLVRRRSRRRR